MEHGEKESLFVVGLLDRYVVLCFAQGDRAGNHPLGGRIVTGLFCFRVFVFELCDVVYRSETRCWMLCLLDCHVVL